MVAEEAGGSGAHEVSGRHRVLLVTGEVVVVGRGERVTLLLLVRVLPEVLLLRL